MGRAPLGHPWDGFLVGPENALAHAAVIALARGEDPGLAPLVVHGPSGVGKSRLLEGLVAEWLGRHPGAVVAHLDAESFAAACAEAAAHPGGWAELREHLRAASLFVLEDLHGLERATLALAELGHSLDALDEAGAIVAVSAREGPGSWSALPPRLVSRLSAGLAVRVDPPGVESRRRFVLERARARGLTLGAEAVEALAGPAEGYRPLEGLIARLEFDATITRRPPGARQVEEAREEAGGPSGTPSVGEVAGAVARRFGVRVRDLRSADRHRGLVEPRHLAIYLARRATGRSYAAIGHYFGRRDPATVRHACRMAETRLAADPALAAVADTILGPHAAGAGPGPS